MLDVPIPAIAKTLKYQELIDSLELSVPCPDLACQPVDRISFRWVKADFSDGQSFLPNYIYDKNRGKPPRRNDISDKMKCSLCALSFFESLDASNQSVETIGGPSRIEKLLGYTHVAQGNLQQDEGLASVVDHAGHFIFFEFVDVVLEQEFTILGRIE
jgi:hypothetical protein